MSAVTFKDPGLIRKPIAGPPPWYTRAACNPLPNPRPKEDEFTSEVIEAWVREKTATNAKVAAILYSTGREYPRNNDQLAQAIDPDWWTDLNPKECPPEGIMRGEETGDLNDAEIVTAPACLAQRICREACPVKLHCYKAAVDSHTPPTTTRTREYGIWGGEYFSTSWESK